MNTTNNRLQFPAIRNLKPSSAISRASRVIHILQILSQGRGYTVNELSEILGIGVRTLYRDLTTIEEELHVAMDISATHQYSVRDTHLLLPSVGLTLPESLALVILCNEYGRNRSMPFFEAAVSAASKIQGYLPSDFNAMIESLYKNIDIIMSPRNPLVNKFKFYRETTEAQRSRRALMITYNSLFEGTKIKNKVYPYKLFFQGRSWYLVGWSTQHAQVRTYNLGRIASLTTLDETFTKPETWSLKDYFGSAWSIIPEGKEYQVVIDFTKMVGHNVEEVLWHKNQQTEWVAPDRLRFRTVVDGLKEISWWVLGYGAQATVVEPPELRVLIAEHVLRLYETYAPEIRNLKKKGL